MIEVKTVGDLRKFLAEISDSVEIQFGYDEIRQSGQLFLMLTPTNVVLNWHGSEPNISENADKS